MVFDQVSRLLQTALSNNYISAGLTLFLALYAGMAKPQLPEFVAQLFENPVFRMAILALVVYMSTRDLRMAIMVAVAFTLTMNLVNEQRISEGFMAGIQENIVGQMGGGENSEDTGSSDGTEDTESVDDEISSLDESSDE